MCAWCTSNFFLNFIFSTKKTTDIEIFTCQKGSGRIGENVENKERLATNKGEKFQKKRLLKCPFSSVESSVE